MQKRWATSSKRIGLDKPILQRTAMPGNGWRRIVAPKDAGLSPLTTGSTTGGGCRELRGELLSLGGEIFSEGGDERVAETTLLTNALLIDCTGVDPHESASVVIGGEKIREVRLGGPDLPADTTRSSIARG